MNMTVKAPLLRMFKSLVASGLLLAALVSPAYALSLEQAKSQGLVGETPGGYLAPVSAPNAEVQALINDINSKRRQKYAEIAAKNGTSLTVVEGLAGKRAIAETPAGQFVQNASGAWQKK